jgi:hypothetical protein
VLKVSVAKPAKLTNVPVHNTVSPIFAAVVQWQSLSMHSESVVSAIAVVLASPAIDRLSIRPVLWMPTLLLAMASAGSLNSKKAALELEAASACIINL